MGKPVVQTLSCAMLMAGAVCGKQEKYAVNDDECASDKNRRVTQVCTTLPCAALITYFRRQMQLLLYQL